MQIQDEFPLQLSEALKILLSTSVSDSLLAKVIEEAFCNELLYRFKGVDANPTTDARIRICIQEWSRIILRETGLEFQLTDLVIK